MGAYYDEIEIEDMAWDEEKRVYHYPCPCGDRFEISRKQLKDYEDIATCPSCSLVIRIIFDPVSLSSNLHPVKLKFLPPCSWTMRTMKRALLRAMKSLEATATMSSRMRWST